MTLTDRTRDICVWVCVCTKQSHSFAHIHPYSHSLTHSLTNKNQKGKKCQVLFREKTNTRTHTHITKFPKLTTRDSLAPCHAIFVNKQTTQRKKQKQKPCVYGKERKKNDNYQKKRQRDGEIDREIERNKYTYKKKILCIMTSGRRECLF